MQACSTETNRIQLVLFSMQNRDQVLVWQPCIGRSFQECCVGMGAASQARQYANSDGGKGQQQCS
jgi:hypothetical protein